MKAYVLVALLATSQAVKLNWPSVAKCTGDHISSDSNACDHDNRMEHAHDGTTLQIGEQWPSVAKCTGDHISSDSNACDHDNRMEHAHDGTTL